MLAYVPLRLLVLGWHHGPLLVNMGSRRGAVSGLLSLHWYLPYTMVCKTLAALRRFLPPICCISKYLEYYFVSIVERKDIFSYGFYNADKRGQC